MLIKQNKNDFRCIVESSWNNREEWLNLDKEIQNDNLVGFQTLKIKRHGIQTTIQQCQNGRGV